MNYESLQDAVRIVNDSVGAYCHYITPNDVGVTGGHQCGFTFSKSFYPLFFDIPGTKGENKDVTIRINWQCDYPTDSRVIYYGKGTRNEYRITRFGRGFEFLKDEYVGSLMIMTKTEGKEYNAYVLSDQSNIEDFMAAFNLDVTKGNQWIEKNGSLEPDERIGALFSEYINSLSDFPDTTQMAAFARQCICRAFGYDNLTIKNNPDAIILKWIDAEYQLYGKLEEKLYRPIFTQPFETCQDLITFSNTILNRRKSRAGKSLEHHLCSVFDIACLKYKCQAKTEGKKRPDFIFPSEESYHDFEFPASKLIMLGAKTTCKDRWRQVLNEANRIPCKHLFTLQQGISNNQLAEMRDEHLTLVVPKANLNLFGREYHDNILCLSDFIGMVREKQS